MVWQVFGKLKKLAVTIDSNEDNLVDGMVGFECASSTEDQ
jgi:hypothetical protein